MLNMKTISKCYEHQTEDGINLNQQQNGTKKTAELNTKEKWHS